MRSIETVLTVIIDETIRGGGVGLTLAFAAAVCGIPFATSPVAITRRSEAIVRERIGELAANVAGSVVSGVGKALRLPVALRISNASRGVGEGASLGLALATEEFAKLFVGENIANLEAINLGESPWAPVFNTLAIIVVPQAGDVASAGTGSGISALARIAGLGSCVPNAVGVGRSSRRHAFARIVGAGAFNTVGILVCASSIEIPLAARIHVANGLVEEDAAIGVARLSDGVPDAGRISGTVQLVAFANLAVARSSCPATVGVGFAGESVAEGTASSVGADTKIGVVVGEKIAHDLVGLEDTVAAAVTSTSEFFGELATVELSATAVEALELSLGIPFASSVGTADTLREFLARRSGKQVADGEVGEDLCEWVEGETEVIDDVGDETIDGLAFSVGCGWFVDEALE